MLDLAIKAEHLTKQFGKYKAVDDVSFEIPYGSIFGFLGANGAGKSTTIRMLTGILASTSGTGTVAGFDINLQTEQIKQAIGYVSQRFSLYTDLTAQENLLFYGQIYGLSVDELRQRMEEIFKWTGLEVYRNRLASELSGGWKQKLAIANALMHKPRIVFLDEPTAGIDPLSRRAIWELLYQLADDGVALFVTTHYMEEAERCNTIAFISAGKILRIGSPQDLKDSVSGKLLQIDCSPLMKASRAFGRIQGVQGITVYGTTLNLNVKDIEATKQAVLQIAAQEGIVVNKLEQVTATLEDVFSQLDAKQDV